MEVGLGKTITTLTIISEQYKGKTLIVAPLKVAQTVWDREASNWEHTKHLRVAKILGTEKQRIAALQQDADIYVTNVENLVWLTNRPEMLVFTNFVVDESQKFKDTSYKKVQVNQKVSKTVRPPGYFDRYAFTTGPQ